MLTTIRLPSLRCTMLMTVLSFLAAAFALQVATAQSQPDTGNTLALAQEEERPASDIGLASMPSTSSSALRFVSEEGGVLSGRQMMLTIPSAELEALSSQYALQETLVNRNDPDLNAPVFPRVALLGIGKGNSVRTRSKIDGRSTAPRLGLAFRDVGTDRVGPGNEGLVLMSIDF